MFVDKSIKYNKNAMVQRDLDRSHFLKNFQNLIVRYEHIVIFHHVNADGDCLGAAFGLKEIIQDNYPDKKAYVVGTSHNDLFSWMGMKFDNSINFNFDFGTAMAVIVDVGSSERIDLFDRFFKDSRLGFGAVIKIDHHDTISDFHVDLTWDDPTYVSTCEQIIQIADYYGWYIAPKAANFLYLGCVTDSLSFSVASVTPRSFILAAKAVRAGAETFRIHTKLSERSLEEFQFSKYLMNNAKLEEHVIYAFVPKEAADSMKISSPKHFVNVYRNIKGLWMWILMVEKEDNIVDVSIRSIHASSKDLAVRYGGGGHEYASSCRIQKSQIEPLIHDANVIVANAKQEKFYESQLKGEESTREEQERIRDAVYRKNPEVIAQAKDLLDDIQREREDGLYDPIEGKKSVDQGYEK